jgi:hypothetical protein
LVVFVCLAKTVCFFLNFWIFLVIFGTILLLFGRIIILVQNFEFIFFWDIFVL